MVDRVSRERRSDYEKSKEFGAPGSHGDLLQGDEASPLAIAPLTSDDREIIFFLFGD